MIPPRLDQAVDHKGLAIELARGMVFVKAALTCGGDQSHQKIQLNQQTLNLNEFLLKIY